VLPFDSLSRDPDNAYFTEGIQEEILTRLAKIADLKVISRASTQRFKSAPDNLPVIAKQLGVTNILEGSVQKSADRVRVNVQLINALTDAHLWADIYDRKLTDIFAVESDIAKTIADTLQAKLTGSEEHAIAARPTENTLAEEFSEEKHKPQERKTALDEQSEQATFETALAQCNYETVLEQFSKAKGIEHRFCDPESKERKALGIEESDWRKREHVWLSRIADCKRRRVLFVCGDNHYDAFAQLLESNGFSVRRGAHYDISDEEFHDLADNVIETHEHKGGISKSGDSTIDQPATPSPDESPKQRSPACICDGCFDLSVISA
jgi:TolB-like protein